jgi:hypothetical protein
MKNETLEWRDYMYSIEKARPKVLTPQALPESKQEIFTMLCNLRGNDYIKELNRLRK